MKSTYAIRCCQTVDNGLEICINLAYGRNVVKLVLVDIEKSVSAFI